MPKQVLRDIYLKGVKRSSDRYEITDVDIPNFVARIGPKKITFMFVARYGDSENSSRRTIGVFKDPETKAGKPKGKYPYFSTEEARAIAKQWKSLLEVGRDPAMEREEEKRQELLKKRSTFRSVIQDYIQELPSRKRNRNVKNDISFIRRNIINPQTNPWMEMPIGEVRDYHVSALVQAIRRRGAPSQALKTLVMIRTFFGWAMVPDRRRAIGLEHNPVADLPPKSMGLEKGERERIFMYEELQAYLLTAAATPYPWGSFQRALIETGQRRGDVAKMRWSQIDLQRKLWIIPARVNKANQQHHVPLSEAMVELLLALKAAQSDLHGDYVFSLSNGQRAITNFSAEKEGFTERFQAQFESLKKAGDELDLWVWHDVRRTLRTHFAAFASDEVAETAIGHGKKGIKRVYNLFKYRREIRKAFNTWSELLRRVQDGTATEDDLGHSDPVDLLGARR